MEYPGEWEMVFTAKNGKRVKFRPEQSGDTEMLWKMFSTLSKESVSNLLPPFTRERVEGWTSNNCQHFVIVYVVCPAFHPFSGEWRKQV